MAEATDPHDTAGELLHGQWSRQGPLERLPGENINYKLLCGDDAFVLKITTDPEANVDLEEAALARLLGAGIVVPQVIPTTSGTDVLDTMVCGAPARARLQKFLAGTPWRSVGSTGSRLQAIGRTIARIHVALEGLNREHPGADRTHRWDLARAARHRASIGLCKDVDVRNQLDTCLHIYAACALPFLNECRSGMLHGDCNDENILLEDDQVVGILDVGDCQEGAHVQDLAIALSYALQHDGVTLKEASDLVSGYDSVRPLGEIEARVLFPLILGRLAASALIGLGRRAQSPEHETWFSHEDSTLNAIAGLVEIAPNEARSALFARCRTPLPEDPSIAELLQRRSASLGPSLSVSYEQPLHIVSGRGQFLYAADGRPYLDLVNNVCHVGHCHPDVVAAIARQAAKLNTNTRYLHETIEDYAQKLLATMPDALDTCFFVNSGSEANELALRLARAATGASDVLVVDGAYHGSTGNCVAMSPYKFDGPGGAGAPEWVHVVPMPDGYRGEIRGHDEDVGKAYALELACVVGEACARGRSIAGFFVEPILSCGGQVPLPPGYLAAAFEHVRKAGGVCIADEVQVGFGRVGDAFWGFELHDVVPDIVVMGKPIGNGHPLGAVVTTRAIADAFANGMEFFSTFGGNPVSCACGLAVLNVIEEEGLQERARTLGRQFIDGLQVLQDRHQIIGDVRGSGLFLGIELVRDPATLEPADREATDIVNAMRQRGVLLSTDGPLHNVIKIKPPMVLDENDIDMTLRLLDEVSSNLQ
jgi:4-aminobutyrate aminotransferase-like enzyme/Ser/Thr protein kinase RdoA (MazF antagonist)